MITYSQNFQPKLNDKIQAGLRQELQRLKGHPCPFESHSFYAYDDDNLVGGIIFEKHDDIIWIDSLWVDQSHRGQHIGQKLLQHVVDFGRNHHCDKIQLTTFFGNCLPFYAKQGFMLLSSLPHWKYGVDCYFLERTIVIPGKKKEKHD